jgi:hypothetical protein
MSTVYSDFPAASGSAESSYSSTMDIYSKNTVYIEFTLVRCAIAAFKVPGKCFSRNETRDLAWSTMAMVHEYKGKSVEFEEI